MKYLDIRLSMGEVDLVLDVLENVGDKKATRDIRTELQRSKIRTEYLDKPRKNLTLKNNIESIIYEFDDFWQLKEFVNKVCHSLGDKKC